MQKTILFDLLRTFSAGEQTAWLQFIRSDFHLTSTNVRLLGEYIASYSPNWEYQELEKKACWKALFPGKVYRAASLNNYISDLLQCTLPVLECPAVERTK